RQSNSGTHGYIKKKLDVEFSQYAKEMNGNGQIMEGVKSDYSGIGYVGAGYVVHGGKEGIKVLPVYDATHPVAVSPLDADKIAEGKYLFQRPLFQYFKAESRKKVQPFLDFEKSEKGKQIIADAGYYPVK
ncbi:MAG: phosphate ABC transporter substrate-binding protein, partial [Bacteroidota bacterium]